MKTNQLIQSAESYLVANTRRITHSLTMPSSPSDGDLWWEPGAKYPQPWEWESANSLWLAQLTKIGWNNQSLTGTLNFPMPVEFYNNAIPKIKLTFINAYVTNGASAHDATNYYSFQTRYMTGSGTYTTLLTWTENTGITPGPLGISGLRRINQIPNLYIPGNAWNITFSCTKNGTAGNCSVAVDQWVRSSRP